MHLTCTTLFHSLKISRQCPFIHIHSLLRSRIVISTVHKFLNLQQTVKFADANILQGRRLLLSQHAESSSTDAKIECNSFICSICLPELVSPWRCLSFLQYAVASVLPVKTSTISTTEKYHFSLSASHWVRIFLSPNS